MLSGDKRNILSQLPSEDLLQEYIAWNGVLKKVNDRQFWTRASWWIVPDIKLQNTQRRKYINEKRR